MSKTFAIFAGLLAAFACLTHIVDWALNMYVLENVNWQGPLQSLADIIWLMSPLTLAGAIVCLTIAILALPQNTNSKS